MMETIQTGINSIWYAQSMEEVKRINKERHREHYVCFSRKVYPFRIDEIFIDLQTEEKIFVEHRKDEAPRIYVKEQHGNYFKIRSKEKVFSKEYEDFEAALKDAHTLLVDIPDGSLKVLKNGQIRASVINEKGAIQTFIK